MTRPERRDSAPSAWRRWEHGDLVLELRLQPRARREGVAAVVSGRLRVQVNAAPVGGAANRRLVELLSRELGVPRSSVEIERGASSRCKRVRIRAPTRRPVWLAG